MFNYFTRTKDIHQLGVLVHDLGPSTMNYGLISLGNRIVNERQDIDIYCYIGDWKTPPRTINFPALQYRNILSLNGTIVSTSLDTTLYMKNIYNASRKLFYIWNLDEHLSINNLDKKLGVYCDKNIELMTRSTEYAEIIGKNFNRSVLICEDFDSPEFLNIILNKE